MSRRSHPPPIPGFGLLATFLGFTFLGAVVVFTLALVLFLGALQMKATTPKTWNGMVVNATGVKVAATKSVSQNTTLTADQSAKLSATGKDPVLVARAIQTYGWCTEQFGADKCDPALWITLTNGESANCSNAGTAFALAEMQKRGFTDQIAAFNTLVPVWKKNDIRSNPNSHAKEYIPADYNAAGIKGSVGAGALGCSQFMAGTAKIHYAEIGEPFDLWDPDTAMKLMAAETARLGYKKSNSAAVNIQAMLGWNQDRTWITSIVSGAQALASSVGQVAKDVPQTSSDLKAAAPEIFGEQEDWQKTLLAGLNLIGLGPDMAQVQAEVETQQAAKVQSGLNSSSALPVPGAGITGSIVLNLTTEVPNDGEGENVKLWAQLNPKYTLEPGATWDFCTQTNQTGWTQYRVAGGVEAGGICFNASMLRELANAHPDKIQVVTWSKHAETRWIARLHTVIWCPGTTLTLKNISSETITIVWGLNGDQLTVGFPGETSTK